MNYAVIRKFIFFALCAYVATLSVLGILLFQASPGPHSQAILGVGIGNYYGETGIAYFSGRRLTCTALPQPTAFTSKCSVIIAGKPLDIYARRNAPPNLIQLGGTCEAVYDNQQWPCEIGSRHVHTHWFAYLKSPLGLDAVQIAALRQQYLIENLSEGAFLRGGVLLVTLTTILGFFGTIAWFRSRMKNKWTVLGVGVASGLGGFISSCLFVATLTSGFWD